MRPPERDVLLAEVLGLELEAQGGHEGRNFELDGPDVIKAIVRAADQ